MYLVKWKKIKSENKMFLHNKESQGITTCLNCFRFFVCVCFCCCCDSTIPSPVFSAEKRRGKFFLFLFPHFRMIIEDSLLCDFWFGLRISFLAPFLYSDLKTARFAILVFPLQIKNPPGHKGPQGRTTRTCSPLNIWTQTIQKIPPPIIIWSFNGSAAELQCSGIFMELN